MHNNTIFAVFDNKFRNIGVPPKYLDKISSNNEVHFEFFSEHNNFTFKDLRSISSKVSPVIGYLAGNFRTEESQFPKRV